MSDTKRVFGIAGFKNSGKTTLMVELIKTLTAQGVRVATLKHAHHEFDIDQPGKDSYKHREAGAAEVLVVSARRSAHIREFDEGAEPPFDTVLAQLGDVDLVLVEGYKFGDHPRLELRRAGVDAPELAGEGNANIRAIVSDAAVQDAPVPVLPRDDVAAIANFILQQTGLKT